MALPLRRALTRLVGREWVLSSRLAREVYAYDAGTLEGLPDLVVLPRDRDEVVAVVSLCHVHGVPLVARGAGTCLSGGPVATQGGVVLALTRMNRILSLDSLRRVAVAEPGVVNADLQKEASRWGLFLPADPSSFTVSTLGGNAAENAGGPRAVRHGVFRQHVMGLEYVLADGTLAVAGNLDLGPCPDLPRPVLELASVIIGSEGTLAVLTKLALKLTPVEPGRVTMLAFFTTAEEAARAVSGIVSQGLGPSALEVMGRLDIRLAEASLHLGLPEEAEAMLLVELDGPGPGLPRQLAVAEGIARDAGAMSVRSATDPAERENLWLARRASSGAFGKLKPSHLALDIAVPRHRIPEMFRKVSELASGSRLPISLIGHAGDGNLHPDILMDDRLPEEVREAETMNRALVEEAVRLGGTVTGEHGIGAEKLEFMNLVFSPAALDCLRAIKRAFDPSGLLNPGKVVPPKPTAAEAPAPGAALGVAPRTGASAGVNGADRAIARLEGLLPGSVTSAEERLEEYGFGGRRRPLALVLPGSLEELAAGLRLLSEAGVPVWPIGGGSLVPTAFTPFEGGVALSTARLRGVPEILLDNLTFTAGAGCDLEEFNRSLATGGGQGASVFYPVDPWRGPGSTLGGEVATNAVGPSRPRYGSTRDQILGLTFVTSGGDVCRVGGRTIKNVAGYDVTRLVCGSWGVLAVIAEATLRLAPRPEAEALVATPCPDPGLLGALLAGLAREVNPSAMVLLSPESGGGLWQLQFKLTGPEEDVAFWQAQLRKRLTGSGLAAEAVPLAPGQDGLERTRRAGGLALCREWRGRPEPWLAGYAWATPVELPALASRIDAAIRDLGWASTVAAHCSLGTIDFGAIGPVGRAEGVGALSQALARAAAGSQGTRFGLYGWQPGLDEAMAPWHPATVCPAPSRLMRELKRQLDPALILAPAARILPSF